MTSQPDSPDTAPAESVAESAEPLAPTPAFGWTAYAEQINGRFAMLGFIVLLLIELATRQDLFSWLGLR
ncbi:MAG: high light inducible protein [Leptolyngbya sp. DLM2.Bin15]|uniref:chlorophyll a/b-binding protein n=1 Tax=Leptolyngbya sp. CCY15150 TaxID=2767772 RepID=UPI00137E8606|nr:chlorophyll a/b-binding protein [Leptolyngbya sp. CCY15150]TVQ19234.1 MAG: high light inducible protein [Leptolyngbya sp. DLM2.Bin15]